MRALLTPLIVVSAVALSAPVPGGGDPKLNRRAKTMDFLRSKGPPTAAADELALLRLRQSERDDEAPMSSSCAAGGVIDDLGEAFPLASGTGSTWTTSTDRVMGGISDGSAVRELVDGRTANVLRGAVRTANNGGFVQMGLDLAPVPGGTVDARSWAGIELTVHCPKGERYNLHLRTPDCARVFSSYRALFETGPEWSTVRLPWTAFVGNGPGASEKPLDISRLRRLGLLGIGREFDAELALGNLRFYKE